jgi:hypothetical protein
MSETEDESSPMIVTLTLLFRKLVSHQVAIGTLQGALHDSLVAPLF